MDLRRLKQKSNTKEDYYNHARNYCGSLLRTPLKDSKSKKAVNGGSFHVICAPRYLNNNYNPEGLALVLNSLQATEDRNTKYDKEETEKAEQFHQELGSKSIAKK